MIGCMNNAGNGWGPVGAGAGERTNRRRDDETNDISIAGDELQHEIRIRRDTVLELLRTCSSLALFRVRHASHPLPRHPPPTAHLADLSSDLHRVHIDHLPTPFERQFPFYAFQAP
ncbi:hypothetical protein M422DRAFT_277044 [Sphaerobolus stellatus SS14]|uniref:Uncharacterized protein n=1 Tax=Sphaerobolus stellatus (strain SS14) TaxID=990650 RepID=A0A0C9U0M5_SPHS4|nr:hypothetical protein M422DRAFT_277044 [Sphaerobolus stellatus SS14]